MTQRRAVTDEEPLGPRDESEEPAPVAATNDAAFYSNDDDESRRKRRAIAATPQNQINRVSFSDRRLV